MEKHVRILSILTLINLVIAAIYFNYEMYKAQVIDSNKAIHIKQFQRPVHRR